MSDVENTADASLAIRKRIDAGPVTFRQGVILLICFLINFVDGFDFVAMAVAAPEVSRTLAIRPTELGIIFSSALFGMAGGAIFLSPLSDRIGRRPVILSALLIIATSMSATVLAADFVQLSALRFVTGIGIGGMIACATSLVSEFTPGRHRALAVMAYTTGFTIGAISVAPVATLIIGAFGWKMLFLVGAALAGISVIVVFFLLPESVEYLATATGSSNKRLERINKTLAVIKREPLEKLIQMPEAGRVRRGDVRQLFEQSIRFKTIYLWGIFFVSFWATYFLLNWIPQLFVLSGLEMDQSVSALMLLSTGGLVGALGLGFLSLERNLTRMISAMLSVSVGILFLFYVFRTDNLGIILIMMFALGLSLNGAVAGLVAVVAIAYPATIRGTGIGWSLGIGRLGAILSPVTAGALVEAGWDIYGLLLALTVPPALIAAYLVRRVI